MSKIKKAVIVTVSLLIGLLVLFMLAAFIILPADVTFRLLRWGNADVYDYQKFPDRPLPASTTPFQFKDQLDPAQVQALFAEHTTISDLDAFLEETDTQAFLVIQDDALLYEKYFNDSSQESVVTSFSVAKSFTSALIGIAIEEGYIHSVNDPITNYLPELTERDSAFAAITIRDLLLMSSGIRYEEIPSMHADDAKTYYFPDLRDLALEETEIVGLPGDTFLYNNYHPLLLGLILERATGISVGDYLAQTIWQPIGMAYDGSWSLDENDFEKMESGINGRAVDFAKFGRLYLREGNWDGEQIIPADWVRESTAMEPAGSATYYPGWFREYLPNGYYKYMWWGMERDGEASDFVALGNHGQFIYISPHKDLIIVRHGEQYGIDKFEWLKQFYDLATAIESPTR